jgi:hypothetical protein
MPKKKGKKQESSSSEDEVTSVCDPRGLFPVFPVSLARLSLNGAYHCVSVWMHPCQRQCAGSHPTRVALADENEISAGA